MASRKELSALLKSHVNKDKSLFKAINTPSDEYARIQSIKGKFNIKHQEKSSVYESATES